jgi:hypothetical protein
MHGRRWKTRVKREESEEGMSETMKMRGVEFMKLIET